MIYFLLSFETLKCFSQQENFFRSFNLFLSQCMLKLILIEELFFVMVSGKDSLCH